MLDEEEAGGAESKWQLTVIRRGGEKLEPLKIKCWPTSTVEQLCRTVLKLSGESRIGFGKSARLMEKD
jgi:hypothetical protein